MRGIQVDNMSPGPDALPESPHGHALFGWTRFRQGRIQEAASYLKWLRHAADIGFLNYPMVSELDPFLERTRDHPSYLEFEEELNARWEAVEL
jgi:hypothetical protein